jgi:hypothetical protein
LRVSKVKESHEQPQASVKTPGIVFLKEMQISNNYQTTSSNESANRVSGPLTNKHQ